MEIYGEEIDLDEAGVRAVAESGGPASAFAQAILDAASDIDTVGATGVPGD